MCLVNTVFWPHQINTYMYGLYFGRICPYFGFLVTSVQQNSFSLPDCWLLAYSNLIFSWCLMTQGICDQSSAKRNSTSKSSRRNHPLPNISIISLGSNLHFSGHEIADSCSQFHVGRSGICCRHLQILLEDSIQNQFSKQAFAVVTWVRLTFLEHACLVMSEFQHLGILWP